MERWWSNVSTALPKRQRVAALILYSLLILVCAQLFLMVGTVPSTPKYEIGISGDNITAVDSVEVEIGYAASQSPNSISGLWNTGHSKYSVHINGIEFEGETGMLRVTVSKPYDEGVAQSRRFFSYGYGCGFEKGRRPFAREDRIIVSNDATTFGGEQKEECDVRLRYMPRGPLYPQGRTIVNISNISTEVNESLLRVTSTKAYSCSKSSCVTPDYQRYEGDPGSMNVYTELSHGFVPGKFSTTVADPKGRSIYVDLMYGPGNTQKMLQNALLIVMTIGFERLLQAVYSCVNDSTDESEEESESETIKGPAS